MSTAWLIGGCVLIVVAIGIGRWLVSPGAASDHGAVSEQWLAEHRLSQSAVDHP